MFEDFSERARRIVFFSLKLAGRRGAAAIGEEDLMQALILEDQADYSKLFPESTIPVAVSVPRPFFTADTAAEIERGLEPLMPSKAKPLPTSVDMPLSEAAQRVLLAAKELSEELRGPAMLSRIQVQQVEPLHLVAAVLSENTSATAGILKQAGIGSETVIAAIKSGEYS
jgi:ATP-dependent Clp protease ATP-binding subunit ClpA